MKRFYKAVAVEAGEGGFTIALDGHIVKTPAKATLVMPTETLAEAVAAEWAAQEETVKPDAMPLTRLANTALDRVALRMEEVAAEVVAFGGSDLLCYRADEPEELVARQAAVWTPYLDWARDALGAPLIVTSGIMPVLQPEASLVALRAEVAALDAHRLTALHGLTNGFGSLVLALARIKGFAGVDALWEAARLDETYQEEQWGVDEEAARFVALKKADVDAADRLLACL
ncbi:ATP12 family chaperone protein [Pseudokordiimonas caeni]|uniref:ATP12 family chaperone protein n=1 Tax=Pseudokordiimonas caeni TaxID=2997908 RepID=UPI0028118708|nr:ATP12 family protein [Pseudokordiimonas caeni]